MTETQTSEAILQLDPSVILADDNARFRIRKLAVEKLAADILAYGSVHTPGEVEELAEPVDGKLYRLTVGHIRHAAVTHLNKEVGAGLSMPVIVRSQADPTARLKRQLSENLERENMSAMDMSVAINKLLEAKVPRQEIRNIFSRPTGKKGLSLQPASNAWINMVASFSELPKAIQEKLDDGRLGINAGYELTRITPEKRAIVLQRAEEARIAMIEAEEKEETRYLTAEAKAQEKVKEAEEAVSALEQAKLDIEKTAAAVEQAKKAEQAAATPPPNYLTMTEKEKEPITKRLSAAKTEVKETQAAHKKAVALADKLSGKTKAVSEQAAAAKKKLAEARKAKPVAKGKGKSALPGGADIKRAAAQEGVSAEGAQFVPLNASAMRAALTEMSLPAYPKVMAVVGIMSRVFSGELTPHQGCREMAEYLSESNVPKAPAAAKPAEAPASGPVQVKKRKS